MSHRSTLYAVLAAASLLGISAAIDADAQEAFSIDVDALDDCFGEAVCALNGADISIIEPATGRVLEKKLHNDATGFGVSGGPSGAEIDVGETLRVDLNDDTTTVQSRSIAAIRILFLYNGPEYDDRAEMVKVTVDGGAVYTLSTRNDADDAEADWNGPGRVGWSGPGKVENCGATTSAGTGCFTITDPFPGAVSRLDFTAIEGGEPYGDGAGTNESDYSIEYIDVAADVLVNLGNCANPDPVEGCPFASVGGQVAASWNNMQVTAGPGASLDSIMRQVRLPDCRYIPGVCLDRLPPENDSGGTPDQQRAKLITLGVIKSLAPSGPNKLHPATQLLIVNKLLPPEITELFPGGLPQMTIDSLWGGQEQVNEYYFDGLFFQTDSGLVFRNTFGGEIDVSVLTGHELGCEVAEDNLDDLFAWDVITSVSELAKSVGGRYMDTMINVGCINPTKVSGVRLSLHSVNLAIVKGTYGPTIKSFTPKITENNDAVFARLVERLWKYEGEILSSFACKQADTLPSGGPAPLSSTVCKKLAALWVVADLKVKLCVGATFYPASAYRDWICGQAAESVNKFQAALPATATGPDVRNRLGELKARVEVFEHVWITRFLESVERQPTGFCREWGTC